MYYSPGDVFKVQNTTTGTNERRERLQKCFQTRPFVAGIRYCAYRVLQLCKTKWSDLNDGRSKRPTSFSPYRKQIWTCVLKQEVKSCLFVDNTPRFFPVENAAGSVFYSMVPNTQKLTFCGIWILLILHFYVPKAMKQHLQPLASWLKSMKKYLSKQDIKSSFCKGTNLYCFVSTVASKPT